jgi:ribosomal protein S18 acetylase RimI-like enzyme
MDARNYSATETLRDGSVAEVRAQRPDDREGMRRALKSMSEQSIVRRFFAPRRGFSPQEVAKFLDIDFEQHVALVAITSVMGRPQIVGGARYVMSAADSAEVAFAIDDAFQHKGLGSALMKHLILIAREKGLREFTAEMLPENTAMLGLLRKSGLELSTRREHGLIRARAQLHSSITSLADHHD